MYNYVSSENPHFLAATQAVVITARSLGEDHGHEAALDRPGRPL